MIIMEISLHPEDRAEQKLYQKAYEKLTNRRREQIDRRKFEQDKIQMITASILKNVSVGRFVRTSVIQDNTVPIQKNKKSEIIYQEISFETALTEFDMQYEYPVVYGGNGKPLFAGEGAHIFFNVSHSKERVVCMVHDAPVGIDIEGIRANAKKVAERFFTPEEYEWMCSQNEMYRFLRLWTLKEAYAKVTGIGIAKGLHEVSFVERENELYFQQKELNTQYGIIQFQVEDQVISGMWQKRGKE